MKFDHKRIDIRRIERIFVARINGLESLSTRGEEKKKELTPNVLIKLDDRYMLKKNVKYPITFAEFRVSRLLRENSFRFPVLFD